MKNSIVFGPIFAGFLIALVTPTFAQTDIVGGPTEAPENAAVNFIDLKKDQKVEQGSVIYFSLSGMGIAPAGVVKANTGHHHLFIDEAATDLPAMDQPIPSEDNYVHFGAGQTEYVVDLPTGPHTLRLVVGDANHTPHSHPVLSKPIRIVVVAGTTPVASDDGNALETVNDCDDCEELIIIPAGTFRVGSKGGPANETPRHNVKVDTFAIGKRPVTFAQWQLCVDAEMCKTMPDDRGWGEPEDHPIMDISWNDTRDYTNWLSAKTGKTYRLPTEAEWEYATRAGTTSKYWWGVNIEPDQNANCRNCRSDAAELETTPVEEYAANPWGLYDTLGNVAEWVEDCWHSSYKDAPTTAVAWEKEGGGDCAQRILKGGYFGSHDDAIRSASRSHYDLDVRFYGHGFRVARDIDAVEQ